MKTDKIVIVGGGSAGWMTAATLIRTFPDKDISVIESPDVPTVGVGESTLGQIVGWVDYIGIDEEDFFPFTDATYKMGIKFTDFYKKDAGAFHYPFGSPDNDGKGEGALQDWYVVHGYYPELRSSDMVDFLFPAAQLWERNKFYDNKDGRLGNFNPHHDTSYHFDAARFGLWLRERYCEPRGVKYIPKHVEHVAVNEQGVEFLVMADGETIYADLFVDCTGFRSLLLGGALNEPFISYGDILPNDRAWATQIPYKDKYKELEPYTNCTAIGNGWVWNIPLWSRLGTGYVYSSSYIADDLALEEYKDYLCSDKALVPRTREEVESFTYRNIKMRIGQHERGFVKNVVAIGLSAGFIEPLESNGLYSVHEFLFRLIDILQRGEISQFDRQWYSSEVRDMFDGFAKFVSMHYAMSHRSDTAYWQANMDRDYSEHRSGGVHEPYIGRSPAFHQGQRRFYDVWKPYREVDGINYIAIGMEYRQMFGHRILELENSVGQEYSQDKARDIYQAWKVRRRGWETVAKEAPHMVDYMQKHFHNK